jgi:hypothetical protein
MANSSARFPTMTEMVWASSGVSRPAPTSSGRSEYDYVWEDTSYQFWRTRSSAVTARGWASATRFDSLIGDTTQLSIDFMAYMMTQNPRFAGVVEELGNPTVLEMWITTAQYTLRRGPHRRSGSAPLPAQCCPQWRGCC